MLKSLLLVVLCFGGVSTGEETKAVNDSPQYTIAAYRVAVENQPAFIELLKGAEVTMRQQSLITDSPIFRMRSREDPTRILEIFQWSDPEAFERAQQNPEILKWWGQYEEIWAEGGFGLNQFPEAAQPWAQFETID
jgi:hypothetical protein